MHDWCMHDAVATIEWYQCNYVLLDINLRVCWTRVSSYAVGYAVGYAQHIICWISILYNRSKRGSETLS